MAINSSINIVYKAFSEFFKLDESNVPPIEFKEFNDLHRLMITLSSINITSDATLDDNKIVDLIAKSQLEIINEKENSEIIKTLNELSNGFAVELENSFSTLKNNISSIVDTLSKEVKTRYINYIKREGAENLLETSEDQTPNLNDYIFLKWGNVSSASDISSIVGIACANANIKSIELNKFNSDIIVNKLFFGSQFQNISLTPETYQSIINSLEKKFAGISYDINDNNVKAYFEMITNNDSYKKSCLGFQKNIKSQKAIAENCINILDFCDNFENFAIAIKNKKIDTTDLLNQASYNSLINNIDTVMKTVYGLWFYCAYMKKYFYKDSLILTNNIINNSVYLDFVKQGKSINDIYNFQKALYYKRDLPTKGIDINRVMNTKVSESLEKTNLSIKIKEKLIVTKCLNMSFSYTCMNYIKQSLDSLEIKKDSDEYSMQLKKAATIEDFIATRLHGEIAKIDDALYDFIISVFYKDSLVYTLYKNLGKEYITLSKTKTEINENDIIGSNTKVAIQLVLDYLIHKICKIN